MLLFAQTATGEVQGATSATQLPGIASQAIRIKAVVSNAGNVYIGTSTVTKPDGTTDVTTGWELAPGDETPWIFLKNLSELYYICDNATDDLVYFILR